MVTTEQIYAMNAINFADTKPPTINVNSNLSEAVKLMKASENGIVFVVDEVGKIVGVITDKHLLDLLSQPQSGNILAKDAKQEVNEDLFIKMNDSLATALIKLRRSKVVPIVTKDDVIVGQITKKSILAHMDTLSD